MVAESLSLTLEAFELTLLFLPGLFQKQVRIERLFVFEHMVQDASQFVSGSGNRLLGAEASAEGTIVITKGTVTVKQRFGGEA